jgi:hypothetical protein
MLSAYITCIYPATNDLHKNYEMPRYGAQMSKNEYGGDSIGTPGSSFLEIHNPLTARSCLIRFIGEDN